MEIEVLGKSVIAAAIEVHQELGPGLLESTYERCLCHELLLNGIKVERQKILPIENKGLQIDEGYRLDLLVDERIILELKVVDDLSSDHFSQLLTYLKLSNLSLGFLINFNVPLLKQGLKRVVNNHSKS